MLGLGCSEPKPPLTYEVTGEVVELRGPHELVVAHDDIAGFMDAMTMPFPVDDPDLLTGIKPGDRIRGTLVIRDQAQLETLEVVQPAAPIEAPPRLAPGESIPEGALFPTTPIRLASGQSLTLGRGQSGPIAVTFLYTRCPLPEYCPMVVSKLQALQPLLPPEARLLALTLDPEHDTRRVLEAFAAERGATPGRWDFGYVPREVLFGLAEKAGLRTHGKGLGITHDLLFLVLDQEGRLVRRYRDLAFDNNELVALLRGGE